MSNSEMVLVPRALLGAVASALETGNPAPKTLASVRELYLSDDFPDSKEMQEAGKYTSGADWALEGQSAFVNKTAQVPLSGAIAKLEADIPPHQLRVLEELAQLTDRLDKLTAFFDTDVYRSLDVDERGRLKEQCALMGELQRVLTERVAAF